jgi:hypothetical protein
MRGLIASSAALAVAFGIVEGAVVVYLREIVYPEGFGFPLIDIDERLLRVELVREAATLLLLLAAAAVAARSAIRRFAVFALLFGIWDIAYYVTLKVALDWPSELLEWDILFLIPAPWTSPVLAPVLVSMTLIFIGLTILSEPAASTCHWLRSVDWAVELAAAIAILATFFWNVREVAAHEAPGAYPWWLFLAGWLGGTGWFAWRWVSRGGGER